MWYGAVNGPKARFHSQITPLTESPAWCTIWSTYLAVLSQRPSSIFPLMTSIFSDNFPAEFSLLDETATPTQCLI